MHYENKHIGFSFNLPIGWREATNNSIFTHHDGKVLMRAQFSAGLPYVGFFVCEEQQLLVTIDNAQNNLFELSRREKWLKRYLKSIQSTNIRIRPDRILLGIEENTILAFYNEHGRQKAIISSVHENILCDIRYEGQLEPLGIATIDCLRSSFLFHPRFPFRKVLHEQVKLNQEQQVIMNVLDATSHDEGLNILANSKVAINVEKRQKGQWWKFWAKKDR